MRFKAAIRKGSVDSIFVVAATTLVRLGLVVSMMILAPWVGLESIAQYDLFIVGSSLILLMLTVGLDSGLSIVATYQARASRIVLLVAAVGITLGLSIALYFPTVWVAGDINQQVMTSEMAIIMYCYAAGNAVTTVVFSYFRWLQNARAISVLILCANGFGFVLAATFFSARGDILAFVEGLLFGSIGSAVACSAYAIYREQIVPKTVYESLVSPRLTVLAKKLISLSIPYVASSASLIARRVVDRAFLVGFGDPVILGTYALVARLAELVGFCVTLPATGFAPIFIGRCREVSVRKLASRFYTGYLGVSVFIAGAVWVALVIWGGAWFVSQTIELDETTYKLVVPLLVGTLFLGETAVAGFGFVIARKPGVYTAISVAFPLMFIALLWLFSWLGQGVIAIGSSFSISAFLYSTITIVYSERLFPFRYPLAIILALKCTLLASALIYPWVAMAP